MEVGNDKFVYNGPLHMIKRGGPAAGPDLDEKQAVPGPEPETGVGGIKYEPVLESATDGREAEAPDAAKAPDAQKSAADVVASLSGRAAKALQDAGAGMVQDMPVPSEPGQETEPEPNNGKGKPQDEAAMDRRFEPEPDARPREDPETVPETVPEPMPDPVPVPDRNGGKPVRKPPREKLQDILRRRKEEKKAALDAQLGPRM